MKVECKAVLFILFQQFLVSSGQTIPPLQPTFQPPLQPPLLQWLISGLNPNGNQQQPQIPFNPMNFLQLIRPVPVSPSAPAPVRPLQPSRPMNAPTPTYGSFPFLMQQFLQNIRPPLGQQQQNRPGILNTENIGNFQNNLQNTGINTPNLLNIVNLAAWQQLLQGNALGNIPSLLGVPPLGQNQIPITGMTNPGSPPAQNLGSNQIRPAGNTNPEQKPIIPPMITPSNTFSHNNLNLPQSSLPQPGKPVTESSNDIMRTTKSPPFVSLVPVRPINPQNPIDISYVPYTTTIKPFMITTHSSSGGNSNNIPHYQRPSAGGETESTTFVPLYFETKKISEDLTPSTRSDFPVHEATDPTEHSSSSSKFITSMMPTNSAIATEQIVTSPSMVLVTKTNESQVTDESKATTKSQLVPKEDNRIQYTVKPEITSMLGNEKESLPNDNKMNNIATPQFGFPSDKIPNALTQSDELPNEDISNTNEITSNHVLNYPLQNQILLGYPLQVQGFQNYPSQMQGLITLNPVFNYPLTSVLQNPVSALQNPVSAIQNIQIQNQGDQNQNLPYFAYSNPYSNWFCTCPSRQNILPLPFNNGAPVLYDFQG